MSDSWNKKEREKLKQKKKKEKAEKKLERKENSSDGNNLADMMAYVDENGNISSTPPDPSKRIEVKLEDIEIGVPEQVPMTQEELTRSGKVSFFNHDKGFGFIKDTQSQESIFVHINEVDGGVLNENDKVSFETEKGQRGPVAVNVKIVN
jgi:cold shock CspA family protein